MSPGNVHLVSCLDLIPVVTDYVQIILHDVKLLIMEFSVTSCYFLSIIYKCSPPETCFQTHSINECGSSSQKMSCYCICNL